MSVLLPPLFETDAGAATGELRLGVAAQCELRWATVDLARPVEAWRRRFDASPVATMAVGRAMAAAALLLRFSTKMPGRLRVEVAGDGALGKILAEADAGGDLRAICGNLKVDDPDFDVGRAVGEGLFRVEQHAVNREPWVSQTALVDGEIGNDLVHYLHQSQQVLSAALLAVVPGILTPSAPDAVGVVAAGGLLVEALPGASVETIERLEANIRGLESVGQLLVDGGCERLLGAVTGGIDAETLERHAVRYNCSCSRETLLDRLHTLGGEQLAEVAGDDGQAIVECAFCLGQFMFSVEDLLTPPNH